MLDVQMTGEGSRYGFARGKAAAIAVLLAVAALSGANGAPAAVRHAADWNWQPMQVLQFFPDLASSQGRPIGPFANVGSDFAFFKAPLPIDDGQMSMDQLWFSDGTPDNTFPVTDPYSRDPLGYPLGGSTQDVLAVGNTVYFAMGATTWQLWKVDLTTGVISMVKLFAYGYGSLASANQRVFFVAQDGVHGFQLWVSDGTDAGTRMLTDFPSFSNFPRLAILRAAGDLVYFDEGDQLWRSDGTTAGTFAVTPSNVELTSFLGSVGNRFFFSASDRAHGGEIWSSDGTPAGTSVLKDICPGSCGSYPTGFFANYEGEALFAANGGLWKSDGTEAGTTEVTNAVEPSGADPVVSAGTLYFSGTDSAHGTEPWRTDGTAGGTRLLADIRPGPEHSSSPSQFTDLNGETFFTAYDDQSDLQLWHTDGTPGGTTMVSVDKSLGLSSLDARGRELMFVDFDRRFGSELWRVVGPVMSAPSIDSVSPASGPVDTKVTITGTGLNDPTEVTLDGENVLFTSPSPGVVTFQVPAGAGSGPIGVTTAEGTTSTGRYRVISRPTINAFAPTTGVAGSSITIRGTDLDVATSVTVGGVPASFAPMAPGGLTLRVPEGASSGPIAVTNAAGTTTTTTAFDVLSPPTITDFSPTAGPVGTSVTLVGSGLASTVAVRVGSAVTTPTSLSNGLLVFKIPPGAVTGPITLLTRQGSGAGNLPTAATSRAFRVILPPRIFGLTPTSGHVRTSVTLIGTDLDVVTVVRVGSTSVPSFSRSQTRIVFTIPPGASTGAITVAGPAGSTTTSISFRVLP